MTKYFPELAARVRSQRVRQPRLYGDFDFEATPYLSTADRSARSALPDWVAEREPILAGTEPGFVSCLRKSPNVVRPCE